MTVLTMGVKPSGFSRFTNAMRFMLVAHSVKYLSCTLRRTSGLIGLVSCLLKLQQGSLAIKAGTRWRWERQIYRDGNGVWISTNHRGL